MEIVTGKKVFEKMKGKVHAAYENGLNYLLKI